MENVRIQDIPSIKKVLEDAHNLKQCKRIFPFLKPFLKLIGIQVEQIENALVDAEALIGTIQSLATLPDQFNTIFASRGWIVYGSLNVEVAQAAVAKAEAGDIDGAEQDLISYYDEKVVSWNITMMFGVKAFRARIPLAQKALVDYTEGRYHACVPVVLALLDGMVNDLGPRGFFTEGVNLEAWDSIAAHSKGLAELAKVLGKVRRKTTTEPISLPYRNGILHGLDLGYDNKAVAAKSWAALFAARDWALKVEQGQIVAPPDQPKPTLRGILRQIRENADDNARLDAWVPRTMHPGHDFPESGEPEVYQDETPEQKLAEFITYWKARNYGRMAQCLPIEKRNHLNKTAGELRSHYEAKRLQAFEIVELCDRAAGMTVIKTKLIYEENESLGESIMDFYLINQDILGKPLARGKPGSAWVLSTFYA